MRALLRFAALTMLASAIALVTLPTPAAAQFGRRLKSALKQKAEQKVIESATAKEDTLIDDAVGAAKGGQAAPAGTKPDPASAAAPAAAAPAAAPVEKAPWVNYDFVPGDRTIFYADYAEDAVGNFPRRLEFKEGNMEVADLGGERYLRATSHAVLTIPLPETLPERFTIEVDVVNRTAGDGWSFQLQGGDKASNDRKISVIGWGTDGAGLLGGGGEVLQANNELNRARYRGKPATLRVLGDGKYIKVYLDERRLVNVPNATFVRSNALTITAEGRSDEVPVFIGRIRVAESRKSIYDDLAATGRVATQGIRFDTGSDRLKPESGPTLKEIAGMLRQHPELKLRIEGHTDNVGGKDANLALSDRRALAVKAALTGEFQIDPARLESKGFGDTRPAGTNATPEGRQNNRRVELVRL